MSRILTTSSLTILVVLLGFGLLHSSPPQGLEPNPRETRSANPPAAHPDRVRVGASVDSSAVSTNDVKAPSLRWGPLNITYPEAYLTESNFTRPTTQEQAARFVVECLNHQSMVGLHLLRVSRKLYGDVLYPKFDNPLASKPLRIHWLMLNSESFKGARRCMDDAYRKHFVFESVEEEAVTGYGDFTLYSKPAIWCTDETGRSGAIESVASFIEYKGEFYVLGYTD